MTPTEIVGIDPGFSKPAVACLSPKDGRVLRVSAFRGTSPVQLDMSLRAHGIALLLSRYVANVPGPKVIGIEGPSYGLRQARGSMEQLARCRQAIFSALVLTLPDVMFMEIPPASAKLAIAGKGNAAKVEVVAAVQKKFNVALSNQKSTREAQADAVAVAFCTYNRWRRTLE